MVWERSGDAFYATVWDTDGKAVLRLIVEPLPEGMWDWSVWVGGEPVEAAKRGVARTVQEAMRDAESASEIC
jgi:hypothetical protein